MALCLMSIGITYNMLGGISTISGILFSVFALRTIVISQFAKVLLFEAADKNLEAPELTISIYAAYYVSAMVGVFLFCRVRFRLPRPMETFTDGQRKVVYLVSLSVGAAATVAIEIYSRSYGITEFNSTRSLGLAFAPLLMFSQVIAVDKRIHDSGGMHSMSMGALIPWAMATMFGLMDTVRTTTMAPTILYFLTCYFRGYRFKARHYLVVASGLVLFVGFLSPFLLFARGEVADQSISQRLSAAFRILAEHHSPKELRDSVEVATASENGSREQYFSRPGTYLLSRLSLIRADSNVISACASGFHYGLAAVQIEIQRTIPSFLYKNKPRFEGAQDYIGHVSGMSGEGEEVSYPAISAVSDSFGSFGWPGVILFPMICFPLSFIVWQSVFDMSKPWGTVALVLGSLMFGEMMVTRFVPFVLRLPLVIILLSYLIAGVAGFIPVQGAHLEKLRTPLN